MICPRRWQGQAASPIPAAIWDVGLLAIAALSLRVLEKTGRIEGLTGTRFGRFIPSCRGCADCALFGAIRFLRLNHQRMGRALLTIPCPSGMAGDSEHNSCNRMDGIVSCGPYRPDVEGNVVKQKSAMLSERSMTSGRSPV